MPRFMPRNASPNLCDHGRATRARPVSKGHPSGGGPGNLMNCFRTETRRPNGNRPVQVPTSIGRHARVPHRGLRSRAILATMVGMNKLPRILRFWYGLAILAGGFPVAFMCLARAQTGPGKNVFLEKGVASALQQCGDSGRVPVSNDERPRLSLSIRGGGRQARPLVVTGLQTSEVVREEWWSTRLLLRPSFPAVKNKDWALTPIDLFILAALE